MIIKDIARKIGIDQSIAYSSLANIISAIAGLGTVFFIGICLTSEEQGYYFTFGSILALQTFFDLGLTGIMQQYVAHEHAHLKWDESKTQLIGEEKYISRLASLLRFCVKWYGIISILFFAILIVVGYVFFNQYGESKDVDWQLPWVLICLTNSINLFLGPISSILRGLDKVKEMSKVLFYSSVIVPLFSWSAFILGAKLYVVAIVSFCRVIVLLYWLLRPQFRLLLTNLWKHCITEKVGYIKEIFPYQWKIALSWISGYFIFQIMSPVLFVTEGAIVAGQMGLTLNVLNAISNLSMNWTSTKVPLYSRLIENKSYTELDAIFNKNLIQQSLVCLLCLFVFFLMIVGLNITEIEFSGNRLAGRFLSYTPLLLMMPPILCNQFVFSFATYLRCHKQEPFLINSIVVGALSLLSTLVLGNYFGLYGICVGYCALTAIIATPWGYYTFYTKKNEWHN